MKQVYLDNAVERFHFYEKLGRSAIDQMPDEKLSWRIEPECNSMATMVLHMHGNMMSRWTDFLNSDGEKTWRRRDAEFEDGPDDRGQLIQLWEEGWNCLFTALMELDDEPLSRLIYIRNQPLSVLEAINRQLTHYAYHVGQMVFLAKLVCGSNWQTLSIARGKSEQYTAGLNTGEDANS